MIAQEFPDTVYEEYHTLKKMFAENDVEIPFDPVRIAFTNPMFFDVSETGPLMGQTVVVEPGPVTALGSSTINIPRRTGEVVAHSNGRVVVVLADLPYYIGWIPEDEIRVLGPITPEDATKVH